MKKLVIFTHAYPYEGDWFLDTELPFLTEVFREILILPVRGRKTKIRMKVPQRVSLCEPLISNNRSWLLLCSLLSVSVWDLFLKELSRTLSHRPYDIRKYMRILLSSIFRHAFEVHPVVNDLIRTKSSFVAYAYWGNTPALAIPKLAGAGIDCWVRYHGSDLYLHAHEAGFNFPFREEIVSASHSVMVSDNGRDYLLENWGTAIPDQSHVLVSRLGTLSCGLNPDSPNSPTRELVIVSCSYFKPGKRLSSIAKLVRELCEFRSVVWHHFGGPAGGVRQDPKLQAELNKRKPPQLRIEMHGTVGQSEIMSFYKNNRIDLFVNLSSSEGCPVSVMEAISFDIPVVATNVGGVKEVVVTGSSGLLIELPESEDPKKLAKRILDEMQPGGALSRSMPHKFWAQHYDAQKNYTIFARLLSGLPIELGVQDQSYPSDSVVTRRS